MTRKTKKTATPEVAQQTQDLENAVAEAIDANPEQTYPEPAALDPAPRLSRSVIRPERKKAYEDGSCGDDVAHMLKGQTIDQLKALAANNGIAWAWDHLNPGMQRMNFGNVFRSKIKRTAAEAAKTAALAEKVKDMGHPDIAAALTA